MAGAGYKLFNTGDVLTAAQVNTYLQEQVVMVFANATARTTALSSVLAEGMVSYLKDTNATEVYDGSAWVGIGNSGDITGVTAGTGISGGGTSGTVTITNDMATTITAAGDIVVGTGSGTYDNLPIGTTGQVLTADTTVSPYKVKWATPASGGGFTLLSTTTLSSTTTTISPISGDYKHLLLYLKGVTSTTNGDQIMMRFNGDSGGNYHYADIRVLGSTVAGGTASNQAEIQIIDRVQASATNSEYGSAGIWIYRYTSTDWVDGQSQALGHDNTSVMGQTLSFRYDCSAAITSLTILSNNAATIAGTAYLYGVN